MGINYSFLNTRTGEIAEISFNQEFINIDKDVFKLIILNNTGWLSTDIIKAYSKHDIVVYNNGDIV